LAPRRSCTINQATVNFLQLEERGKASKKKIGNARQTRKKEWDTKKFGWGWRQFLPRGHRDGQPSGRGRVGEGGAKGGSRMAYIFKQGIRETPITKEKGRSCGEGNLERKERTIKTKRPLINQNKVGKTIQKKTWARGA